MNHGEKDNRNVVHQHSGDNPRESPVLTSYSILEPFINDHCRNLNLRYLPQIQPIFKAYVFGNIPTKYGQKYGALPYLHLLDPEIPIDLIIGSIVFLHIFT